MKIKLLSSLALLAAIAIPPANATTIRLIDIDGSVTGSKAEEPLRIAADFWGRMLTNKAVVIIKVRYARLAGGPLGVTETRETRMSIRAWEKAIVQTRSGSAIDVTARLPRLRRGAIEGWTLGVDPATGENDMRIRSALHHDHRSARYLTTPSALAGALGLPRLHADQADADITLNSAFVFDYDPSDGVAPSGVDIVGVAIHEMGHVLGFGSGVTLLDSLTAPRGPQARMYKADFNDREGYSALDMFRYGHSGVLDLRPGAESIFSIDGGKTALLGARFATGTFNGDGDQAGHFKQTAGHCRLNIGIMDAANCGGQMGVVTGADLAALDAIGWNIIVDALRFNNLSTADIVREYRARHPSARPQAG